MRQVICVLALAVAPLLGAQAPAAQPAAPPPMPAWAFPVTQMDAPPDWLRAVTQGDDAIRAQVYPMQAETIPEVVRKGKAGDGVCMGCHLPSGSGQPQSAPIAGLPRAYYLRTMADFASGTRKAYRPQMQRFAAGLTPADLQATADYYAALKFGPWVEVQESDVAPRTFVAGREIVARVPGGGDEPLGMRIVEVAKEQAKAYLPPGPAYVAYVPRGSVARGRELANGGAGKTLACTGCHGANLRGAGDVPPLAGRSALHAARELIEYRNGMRGGPNAAPMKDVVARLDDSDIVALAAYLASLPPA
jgi:cytochrome c553